jgi:hypothetical protein
MQLAYNQSLLLLRRYLERNDQTVVVRPRYPQRHCIVAPKAAIYGIGYWCYAVFSGEKEGQLVCVCGCVVQIPPTAAFVSPIPSKHLRRLALSSFALFLSFTTAHTRKPQTTIKMIAQIPARKARV